MQKPPIIRFRRREYSRYAGSQEAALETYYLETGDPVSEYLSQLHLSHTGISALSQRRFKAIKLGNNLETGIHYLLVIGFFDNNLEEILSYASSRNYGKEWPEASLVEDF